MDPLLIRLHVAALNKVERRKQSGEEMHQLSVADWVDR